MSHLHKQLEHLQDTIDEASKKTEEIKSQIKDLGWRPQNGDTVYYSDFWNGVRYFAWNSLDSHHCRVLSYGKVFKTLDEADAYMTKELATTKVVNRIKELNGDWVPGISKERESGWFTIIFDISENKIDIWYDCDQLFTTNLLIKNKLFVEILIKELEPEIRLMFDAPAKEVRS